MTNPYADFERDGEQKVSDNLAQGLYKERRAELARGFLENLKRARDHAFATEQMRIARTSRNVAMVATVVSIIAAVATYYVGSKSIIASNRAWIEPGRPAILSGLKTGEPLTFVIPYANIGKEPALNVVIQAPPRTVEPPKDGNWYSRFPGRNETCSRPNESGLVVYPSTNPKEATTYPNQHFPDQSAVLDGTKALVIEGCISYETFGEPHYSAFCYYVQPFVETSTDPRAIIKCPTHNHAT